MNDLRRNQDKEAGVFIPAVNVKNGEPIDPRVLLAQLGGLGLAKLEVEGFIVDPTPPQHEELIDFDPESEGSLGADNFVNFSAFVEEQGFQPMLATQIWKQFTRVSVARAINRRDWLDAEEFRPARREFLAVQKLQHDALPNPWMVDDEDGKGEYDEELARKNELAKAELHDAEFENAQSIIRSLDAKRGVESTDEELKKRAGQLDGWFANLQDPDEFGQPFISIGGSWEPYLGPVSQLKRKSFEEMTMGLDEAYKVFKDRLVFGHNEPTQAMPQLFIRYINDKIRAHRAGASASNQ